MHVMFKLCLLKCKNYHQWHQKVKYQAKRPADYFLIMTTPIPPVKLQTQNYTSILFGMLKAKINLSGNVSEKF